MSNEGDGWVKAPPLADRTGRSAAEAEAAAAAEAAARAQAERDAAYKAEVARMAAERKLQEKELQKSRREAQLQAALAQAAEQRAYCAARDAERLEAKLRAWENGGREWVDKWDAAYDRSRFPALPWHFLALLALTSWMVIGGDPLSAARCFALYWTVCAIVGFVTWYQRHQVHEPMRELYARHAARRTDEKIE